jgi:hypothetical protein
MNTFIYIFEYLYVYSTSFRYDIVCHLTTAADGAEEYYTNDNNSVRTETKEEALKMDVLTQVVFKYINLCICYLCVYYTDAFVFLYNYS